MCRLNLRDKALILTSIKNARKKSKKKKKHRKNAFGSTLISEILVCSKIFFYLSAVLLLCFFFFAKFYNQNYFNNFSFLRKFFNQYGRKAEFINKEKKTLQKKKIRKTKKVEK